MSSLQASSDNCGYVVLAFIQKGIKLEVLKALFKDESQESSIDNSSSTDFILDYFLMILIKWISYP